MKIGKSDDKSLSFLSLSLLPSTPFFIARSTGNSIGDLPATRIYPGPRDRADILGVEVPTKASRNLLSLRDLFSPSSSSSPRPTSRRRDRPTYRIYRMYRRVGRRRACKKQFRNFPPWLCHLRFAIRLGEIEFSQVEMEYGSLECSLYIDVSLPRIFRIAPPVGSFPSAS